MAGTTQTIQQGPIASRQRQLQARYNLTRHEALKDTFIKQMISDPALLDQVASVQGGFIPRPAGMSTEAAAGKLTGIGLKYVGGRVAGPLISKGVQAVAPSLAKSLGMGGTGGLAGMAGSLAAGAAIMAAFMTVVNWGANKFDPPKKRHMEARAPKGNLNLSINTFLNEHGLGSYKTTGKGSSLGGTPAAKRSGNLSKIVRAVQEKYPGYTQMQYAEFFKRNNMDRFMPGISVSDAKESRKQELLNPETDPAWTTPEQMKKKHGKGAQNAIWTNQQLLRKAALHKEYYGQENFNYRPKELRAGKGSNPETRWRGRRTDMTMEGFFKNVYSSIEDDTFLSAVGATQEQPPAQEQPTREQSLAKNAFKGIGIGSAIVRNVFNPKRLPRPDLGFGQKLFSRQY